MNKYIAAIVLTIILTVNVKAQQINSQEPFHITKSYVYNVALISSLIFLSGMADGTAEALKYRYPEFKKVFPNANDQFWNPNLSWTNKYRNGDYLQGEKFLGSTTVFVWTTDGYHMVRAIRNCSMILAVTLNFGDLKPWYYYIIEGIIYYVSYTSGFTTTYGILFRKQ